MKNILSFILVIALIPTISFGADKWTEENVTNMKLSKVICNEDKEEKYGHGGYFVSFPQSSIQTYMIIGLDKSDDTEHLIGGYDIRAESQVKEITREVMVSGEWKTKKIKVLSVESEMSKVETQIDLVPLLKVLNSGKKSVIFPATLVFPVGNIQEFKMSCLFR